jgi:hypothetical protein
MEFRGGGRILKKLTGRICNVEKRLIGRRGEGESELKIEALGRRPELTKDCHFLSLVVATTIEEVAMAEPSRSLLPWLSRTLLTILGQLAEYPA